MYFIVVHSHSNWPEVIEIASKSTVSTIAELRKLLASYRLPQQVVISIDSSHVEDIPQTE